MNEAQFDEISIKIGRIADALEDIYTQIDFLAKNIEGDGIGLLEKIGRAISEINN